MDHQGLMNPEDWQTLHGALRDDLQKEINLTRELLSNLHQEEVSLMLHDTGSLNQILQIRHPMLESLSSLRLHRRITTEKIEKIVVANHKQPSLEEILPPGELISTEILSLSDQLMALTERLNRQQAHNQRLTACADYLRYPHLQLAAQDRPKRKASVTTINLIK